MPIEIYVLSSQDHRQTPAVKIIEIHINQPNPSKERQYVGARAWAYLEQGCGEAKNPTGMPDLEAVKARKL